jgi:hypothetical protein
MSYWKTGYRTVNYKRRKVRKLVRDGKIVAVRVANTNHFTDKTAQKRASHPYAGIGPVTFYGECR